MKTVLVVEDEPNLIAFLHSVLKHYTVIEATNAEQALQAFTRAGRQVDLLISDVTLQNTSGIQVALLLRSEIPHLPVILTSGYPVSDWTGRDYTDLQRLGTTSVALMPKPFQIRDLLLKVGELVGEAPSEIAKTA